VGPAQRFAAGSIGVGILVLAVKSAAWWLTGSAALYSDALETIVNVAASVVALIALGLAAKPADANHPYGHDKAEFFAAVIEGVLVVVAALSIFEHAWETWNAPRLMLGTVGLGLGLNAVGGLLNALWAAVLFRASRKLRSPALRGDAQHLMADVATSVGVVGGVGLAVLTGYLVLDPLLAVATGVHVLYSGAHMITDSVGGLMDAAAEPAVVRRIHAVIAENATGAIEAHDLRTRNAGRVSFVDFHLVVPGAMSVAESHAICDRIETALKTEMNHLVITIHVEPEAKAKHTGVTVL
jgi:cation diffusion facilitator family transporter